MRSNNRFADLFAEADAAFEGKYRDELNKLMALSKEEIDAAVPGTGDLKVYNLLVKVVENASRKNLSQAQLAEDIKELGNVAVIIARRVTGLGSLV